VAKNSKNVKNWKNGKMVQPWAGAALLDAEYRSNRIAGYRSMSVLISEVQRLTLDESAGVVEKGSIIA
jgi:hypothetical protein